METYEYNTVKVNDSEERTIAASWIPLMRQIFVCSGVCSIYFVLGLCFGAPTVFIPQIRSERNSTADLSDDMASWLYLTIKLFIIVRDFIRCTKEVFSIFLIILSTIELDILIMFVQIKMLIKSFLHGYSALPWVFIIPVLSQRVGRKIPFLIVCVNTIVSFIVFYCSTNVVQLLVSEIMLGMLLASNITLLTVIITEYTSPQYRGVALTIKSTIFFWGIWVANVTGTFLHWKNIGIIAFVCSLYSLTAVVWPESPSWLAIKGRFDECAASHHWLKGFDKDSANELVNLIQSQKEYLQIRIQRKKSSSKCHFRSIAETISLRAFYKPLLLCVSVMSLYHFSGKLVCGMYALDLIKQISGNESTAYIGMLIMDGVTIVGMQVGCTLSKFLNRRTLLIVSSLIGIIFLFIISLYLYLISLGVIHENKILSIFLLTSFSVSISCGPMILPACLFGELIFLRYKSSSLLLLTLFSEALMGTLLKLSPYIFKLMTLRGAFLFYGFSASVFLLILYKYLPETKDKTLQEIESFFEEPFKSDHISETLMDDYRNIDRRQDNES